MDLGHVGTGDLSARVKDGAIKFLEAKAIKRLVDEKSTAENLVQTLN